MGIGRATVSGDTRVTVGADRRVIVGAEGSVATTLDAFVSDASGTHAEDVSGTVDVTLDSFVSAADGTQVPLATGTVDTTLDSFTSAADGWAEVTGTVATTLGDFSSDGDGEQTIAPRTGTVATTLASFTSDGLGHHVAGVFVDQALKNHRLSLPMVPKDIEPQTKRYLDVLRSNSMDAFNRLAADYAKLVALLGETAEAASAAAYNSDTTIINQTVNASIDSGDIVVGGGGADDDLRTALNSFMDGTTQQPSGTFGSALAGLTGKSAPTTGSTLFVTSYPGYSTPHMIWTRLQMALTVTDFPVYVGLRVTETDGVTALYTPDVIYVPVGTFPLNLQIMWPNASASGSQACRVYLYFEGIGGTATVAIASGNNSVLDNLSWPRTHQAAWDTHQPA